MKKSLLIIFLLITANISAFDFPTDLEKYKYKGSIKQITSRYFEAKDENLTLAASSISYFSKDGNYEKIEYFDSENILTHYIIFKTKDKTRELTTYSKTNEIIETAIEEYDYENKKMTEKYIRYDGKTVFIQEYKFSEDGKTIEKSVIDAFGKVTSRTVNEYDKNNNLIGFKTYFSDPFGWGDRTITNVFKLDDHGNVIESLDDFKAKEPIIKYIFLYEYDKTVNITLQKQYQVTREKEKILVKVIEKEYRFW